MSTITASQEQSVVANVPKQLFIAGEWRDGGSGTIPVEDPSTGEILCEVADASVDDARWRRWTPPPTPAPPSPRWPRASAARSCAARSR